MAAAIALLCFCASAKVTLPGLIGSNMVLQRNTEVNIWGKADAGKLVKVTTSWNNKTYKAKADNDGNWLVKVTTTEAGGPYEVTISDGDKIVLENVLLGEVWICSGQSNMEMPMNGFAYQPVENCHEHIVYAAEYPGIRTFNVPHSVADEPRDTIGGVWGTANPNDVKSFSATAYFFGKALYRALGGNIPVGLVSPNWGGTRIECWMSRETIENIPGINHEFALGGTGIEEKAANMYNTMIHPITNFTAKGFIWYQGESNRDNWYDYKELMKALVSQWRSEWGDDKMPFYYVQLAPYAYEGNELRSLALVIEAQYQAMAEIPYSGIAATTDIGNRTCIHPQRKNEVGTRLAYLALANDYGIKGVPRPAPTYKSMELVNDERRGNMLVLSFNNMATPYDWNDGDSFKGYNPDGYVTPAGFEIAGEDKVWHKARGNYQWWLNKVEVWSEEVPNPVAVRYAFCNFPAEANVITTNNQPLAPFRTDDWEITDIFEK